LGDFVYDRIGRGTKYIPVCCLSVLGAIQAGPLRGYMKGAIRDGAGADGLMPRFQLLVYPDIPKTWRAIDRAPDANADLRVLRVFDAIATLDASSIGATVVNESLPFLRFAPDAQGTFDAWFSDLAGRLRSTEEHPAFIAHLANYRSLVPALALLFHVADAVDGAAQPGAVATTARNLALEWAEVLEAHARRIYANALDRGGAAARLLARKIAMGTLAGTFTARDVYRRGWVGLTDADDVQAALAFLEDHHWVRAERENTGGRPRFRYRVNPKTATAKTDKRGVNGASVGFGSAPDKEPYGENGAGHADLG
jgi:putative DNA primase/helicase